jgi:biopolymer transport protein ExbB
MKLATLILPVSLLLANAAVAAEAGAAWWNPAWTQRQTLTLDTTGNAAALTESPGTATVLVRLSDANFPFASAREDGSDLRFIAADGKTALSHQIESYDNLLNEAYVWVKIPDLKPSEKTTLHLYSGNPTPDTAPKAADAYDADTALVWHFAGRGAAPADSTANNNSATAPATTAEGSLVGNGLRLLATPVALPASPSLEWKANQALTLSTWIKPAALQDNAILLSRGEGASAFQILLNQGVPVIRLGSQTSAAAAPVAAGAWSHLALVADGGKLQLFLNGAPYATLAGGLPALATPITLGAETSGFAGELDELTISNKARPESWIKLASVNQGSSDAAQRSVLLGTVEGGTAEEQSHLMQHLSLFGDIANNMMFDGWIAIGVCAIMIVIGWTVAVKKFIYLNSIEKGTKVFLDQWKTLSTDLTALDPGDQSSVSTLGGKTDAAEQHLIEKSPLYHIYQIGSEEIRHRLDKDNTRVQGLNGRSIQAIRASLDAGLVHESHRLSDGLVYLTISIAGGPYVGLLGTVVGVMITFAIIAKSGEVNVNSIAPGIASALLATVVGLVVAIPALFIYSYLNGRIKNSLGLMQVFIDEFVAKMAEFYRPANESDYTGGSSH